MTHTLHRLGTVKNLQDDYVVFAMSAKGINEDGSHKLMRRFLELALDLDPANVGDTRTGHLFSLTPQEILNGITDISVVHVVFTEEEKVATLLARLRQEDLGLSVIVSGLFDKVENCTHAAGLRTHTIEYSLGIWGKTELLPDFHTLEVTTMCGHGLISADRVQDLAREVRKGRMKSEEAAATLAETCICGIFNPVRAARLLDAMASNNEETVRISAGQTSS